MAESNLTPEEQWEKVKKLIFKGETPKNIEYNMQKGFEESVCESEKWVKLSTFMMLIKQRFY